jgi:hypothetical protein
MAISNKAKNFDLSQLPKTIPLISPLLGYTEGFKRFRIHNNWVQAEELVGRPLDYAEEARLAYYIMEVEQKDSYGSAFGAAVGAWRAWKGMERSTYPFYVPKYGSVNPNKFLLIRGPFASIARHSWRFFVYSFIGSQLGRAVAAMFAIPISQQHTKVDPELATFVQDLEASRNAKAQRIKENWERRHKANNPSAQNTGADQSSSAARQESQNEDSAFPTAFDSDSEPRRPAPRQQQEQKQQSTSSWSPWSRQTPSDDDASPTGGMFEEELEKSSTQSQSSWEKLRRGGAPPSPAQRPPQQSQYPRREQTEGSALGDSWTFAGSDEERKRAKERAQREFDERVERERRGEDFDEGGKKW